MLITRQIPSTGSAQFQSKYHSHASIESFDCRSDPHLRCTGRWEFMNKAAWRTDTSYTTWLYQIWRWSLFLFISLSPSLSVCLSVCLSLSLSLSLFLSFVTNRWMIIGINPHIMGHFLFRIRPGDSSPRMFHLMMFPAAAGIGCCCFRIARATPPVLAGIDRNDWLIRRWRLPLVNNHLVNWNGSFESREMNGMARLIKRRKIEKLLTLNVYCWIDEFPLIYWITSSSLIWASLILIHLIADFIAHKTPRVTDFTIPIHSLREMMKSFKSHAVNLKSFKSKWITRETYR